MKDRKLGDEWAGWDGEVDQRDLKVDEAPRTFIVLALVMVVILVVLAFVGLYMIQPRLEQFSPSAPGFMETLLIAAAILLAIAGAAWSFTLAKWRKPLFPSRWIERYVLFLLPKAVWLGSKFGISRDRVGNSFIKAHNSLIKSYAGKFSPERPLVLLPRCLKAETRKEILAAAGEGLFKVVTVIGGEEARRAIEEYRPTFIVAVACERDLMSGMKDVAEKVPVLAIPNMRPEGPCKNTSVEMEDFRAAVIFIKEELEKFQSKTKNSDAQ
ncbi:MAG: DUF116 domain-containing protein [Nitrospiraceae bacterium]|nr:DUF116 domain-containing protein [Nitrospiraceae bacterium]